MLFSRWSWLCKFLPGLSWTSEPPLSFFPLFADPPAPHPLPRSPFLVFGFKVRSCREQALSLSPSGQPPQELHCSTGDRARLFLSLDLYPVSLETKETGQQAPSQPNFEQPLQYSLSRCHFGCVTFFPGKSLKHTVLFTCSGRGFAAARQRAKRWTCPGGSAVSASTVTEVLHRETQVTSLVMGKFS